MNSLLSLSKAEFYVSTRSNASRIVIFLPATLGAIQLILAKIVSIGTSARVALTSQQSLVSNNAYGYFVDSLTTGLTTLVLLSIANAAYGLSQERELGTLRHLLIRSGSRQSIIIAKLLHLHCLTLFSFTVLSFTAYFMSASLWDFGPVIEDGYQLIGESEIWSEIQLGILLAALPIPASICFGLLIGIIAQSPGQALAVSMGLTLTFDIFKSNMGAGANYVFAKFQPSLIDYSYISEVSRMVRGFSDVFIESETIAFNTWIPIPSALLLTALLLFYIRKRPL
ncbi:MAG: hypothetical protein CL926_10845 [Deltaproteobacteria bacterium]|jgi:ABC-type transport system involved in multi-copper enzyme maturation permease subunit|nr:hypothetical protein [Gammaproteobacteria bacterium]MBP79751.1 hypothetical protein [Deltaproteobacteria bacterium]|tara:strand:+ start:3347 stop:4195 length:849 start_codon:yes stop_codon:yes gene_type:complete